MRAGLHSFVDVIFPTLPIFLRRLDTCLKSIGQPRIPLEHAPFKYICSVFFQVRLETAGLVLGWAATGMEIPM